MSQDLRSLGLKPQYTFQGWVVGISNHVPAKACLEVAKSPGDAYNPLFIYGEPGSGKTHLVQAVAQTMLAGNPDLKVKYISAERFMNEVISAIAEDNVFPVRDRYSNLDLLIVDDVQYLMESKSAQAEFFHIFNNLHQDNHQIIVTADRSPNKLKNLDKTILSRFEWGLSTEIKKPDVKARVDILKIKKSKFGLNLTDDMVKYAGGMLRSSVRELEGFLKKINAYVSFSHQELTLDLVKSVVKEMLPEGQADLEPEPIPDDGKSNSKQAEAQLAEVEQVNQVLQQVQNGPQSIPIQPSNQGSAAPADPTRKGPVKGTKKSLEVLMPNKKETKTQTPPDIPPVPPAPSDNRALPEKEEEKGNKKSKKAAATPTPAPPKEKGPEKKEDPATEPEMGDVDEQEGVDGLPDGHKEVGAVFFFPEGGEEALENVFKKFQEVIKKHKLKFRLKRASSSSYKCDAKINYATFVDECKKSKVPVAIVIGPPPSAFIPEQDFYDLLSVTLDVQGISLQLVNWTEINKDYRYLNLALDIALVRSR